MAKRKVFGRIKTEFDSQKFTIEMRVDGIYVRRKHCKGEWLLSFGKLLNHARNQSELFYDDARQPEFFKDPVGPSDQAAPLPDLQKGLLVPDSPERGSGAVHESAQPQVQTPQVGGNGLPAPADGVVPIHQAQAGATPSGHQLPEDDPRVGKADI